MPGRITVRPRFTLLLGILILWGCGDDLTAPRTGSIEVTSTTTGELPDADGYTLTIDGGTPLALGSNSRLTLSEVMAGDHQLELTGLAANCVTTGTNPRPLVLLGGSTTQVTFEVECHTPSGSIRLVTTTRGEDPDADGYTVTLDGGSAQTIGSSGSLDLTGIMPGEHRIHLEGIAPNCAATGGKDRGLSVGTGPVELTWEIVCQPAFGSVVISIEVTGLPEGSGFTIRVDDSAEQPISSGLEIPGLRVGDHQIRLDGLAANCAVEGSNLRTVSVTANTRSQISFGVRCTSSGFGTFLFTGEASGRLHVFRLSRDGNATDLTPTADAERGRLSPDGRKIVFNSARSGTLGIWVMNADGSQPVRLTNNGEIDPEWSPDGRRIVFWPNVTAGFGSITVMNADGSSAHDIGTGSEPNWSSSGRIAFERAEFTTGCIFDLCALNLYTMNADGSDVVKLTSNTSPVDYAVAPAWSPDGTRIAFYSWSLGNVSLKIMNQDGSGIRTVASSGNFSGAAVWSPDGGALAYAVTESGGMSRILVTPVDGGDTALILERKGLLEPTSWVR